MSQEKVDRNKELKKNRKDIVKKNHRNQVIRTVIWTIVVLAIVAWLGYSGYNVYADNKTAASAENPTPIDLTPVSGFSFDE